METTVKEIHNAVDEASNQFFHSDYFAGIEQSAKDLRAMGFTSAQNVLDAEDYKENHRYAAGYRVKYPNFKFMTIHQMNKLMHRYNLQFAQVKEFMGEIPAKNIAELQKAFIYSEDLDINYGTKIAEAKMIKTSFDDIRNGGLEAMLKNAIRESILDHRKKQPLQPDIKMSLIDIYRSHPDCVMIAADPVLFKKPVKYVCPMPFVAVKGGLLILTAWGDEASDAAVVNEKMN
jgi:hypothetical protein